jgi:phage tail-like protein
MPSPPPADTVSLPLFEPDPEHPDRRFLLELDGVVVGVFVAGRGLKAERDLTYVDEGGRSFAIARIGPFAKGHVVLEDGACDQESLYAWFLRSRDGDYFASSRRTGEILYVDADAEPLYRWRFKNARITEWVGPEDRPKSGELYFVDKLGISHEGLEPVALEPE